MATDFEIGFRIKTSSDDAALQQFLQDLQKLSASAKAESQEGAEALKNLGDAGKKAGEAVGEGMSRGSSAVGTLREAIQGTLLDIFGLAKAKEFLTDIFTAAVTQEKELVHFRNTMQAVTGVTKEQAEALYEWVAATALVTARSKDELIPAMVKFGAVTGDAAAAQSLLKFALEASRKSGADLSEVVDDITRAAVTGVVRGTDPFAVSLRKLLNEGLSVREALLHLAKSYAAVTEVSEDTARQLGRAKIAWEESKELLGAYALRIWQYVAPAVQYLGTLLGYLVGAIQLTGTVFGAAIGQMMDYGAALKKLVHGDIQGSLTTIRNSEQAIVEQFRDGLAEMQETVHEFSSRWDLAAAKAKARSLDLGESLATAVGKIRAATEDNSDALEKEESALQQLAQAYQQLAREQYEEAQAALARAHTEVELREAFALTLQRRKALLDQELAADVAAEHRELTTKELTEAAKDAIIQRHILLRQSLMEKAQKDELHAQEMLVHSLEALDRREEAAELEQMRESTEALRTLLETEKRNLDRYNTLVLSSYKTARLRELEELKKSLQEELHLRGITAAREAEIAQELKNTEIAIEREKARAKADLAARVAETMIGFATEAFGQNKALSIAETIISTYAAAQKAYESMVGIPVVGPSLARVAAALAVAAGLARVQRIEKQGVPGGRGFDDPRNDYMAERGGELGGWKWADDMIARYSMGIERGWAKRLAQEENRTPTTNIVNNNNTRGPVIYMTVHNPIGATTDLAFRKLDRRLRVAGWRNDHSVYLGARTVVGTGRSRG